MLKTTPFHPRTASLCVSHSWRRWAGYVAASSYELSHEREYHSIRSSAALFDISPLYKYRLRGPDAARLLDRVTTRDVSGSQVGQVLYTGWCDGAGKLLDDGTVARLGEALFRMTSADPNLRWLQDNALGLEVEIEDISESVGALSLQGPSSKFILQELGELPPLKYFRLAQTRLRGIPVSISRTGYTGDLGYEIWVSKRKVARALGRAHGCRSRLRHHAGGHARARRGAHRGGPHAARRRLRLGAQGAHRKPDLFPL